MPKMTSRNAAAIALLCMSCVQAFAQNRTTPMPFQGGKAIYDGLCQGCHMSDAKGAVGAGMYPALANNPKLEVAGYPVAVIAHGQKGMPALGGYLDDRQIADVVNYIRTHFGNNYKDQVTPENVKAQR